MEPISSKYSGKVVLFCMVKLEVRYHTHGEVALLAFVGGGFPPPSPRSAADSAVLLHRSTGLIPSESCGEVPFSEACNRLGGQMMCSMGRKGGMSSRREEVSGQPHMKQFLCHPSLLVRIENGVKDIAVYHSHV